MMLTAQASVATARSRRYLVQLCRDLNVVARGHPHLQAQVEWSDDRGVINFGWGRCTLRADPSALTLRVVAPDRDRLHLLERRVADRLEHVGRRDHLTVTWTHPAWDKHGNSTTEDNEMTSR